MCFLFSTNAYIFSWTVNKVDIELKKDRFTFYIHPDKQHLLKPYQDMKGIEEFLNECNKVMIEDVEQQNSSPSQFSTDNEAKTTVVLNTWRL